MRAGFRSRSRRLAWAWIPDSWPYIIMEAMCVPFTELPEETDSPAGGSFSGHIEIAWGSRSLTIRPISPGPESWFVGPELGAWRLFMVWVEFMVYERFYFY